MELLPARTKRDILVGVEDEIIKSRLIRHSTVLYETAKGMFVRYHDTDIVAFMRDGTVVIRNGGFYTINTRDRVNEHLVSEGIRVATRDGEWWVTGRAKTVTLFYDGMVFKDGKLVSKAKLEDAERKKLKKKLGVYLKGLKVLPSLPAPNGGDCWLCYMRTEEGEALGDKNGDKEHLRQHVEEGYTHGSLIHNALRYCGCRDPQFVVKFGGRDQVVRAVRDYLYDKLGFPR